MTDPRAFRGLIRDVAPACRTMTDAELRAFGVAILAELARRKGATVAATWAASQATRLRCMDAITIEPDEEETKR